MESHEKIVSIFGEEVKHLHGNLFRIKRKKIKIAKQGLATKDGNLVYGNPRWYTNSIGEHHAKGIEKEKMLELRTSIQEDGLENPIRLRVSKDKTCEIINGERRFRCIVDLVEKDLPVFDPKSKKSIPATDFFEWVECRIEFMDDQTALRVALRPNETSEIIGDLANLNLIKILRQSNFDDQEILKTTGKSISWLRETEKIISLDDTCLENFKKEKINRTVALRLALIENVEERVALLDQIKDIAETKHKEKIKQASEKIKKIEQNKQIAEISANFAKTKGDTEAEKKHADIAKNQSEKAEKIKKDIKNLSEQTPTATSKDIDSIEKKPLSHKKIKLIYVDLINEIIENEGCDEDGDSYGLNLDTLNAVSCVLQEILSGNKNSLEVLGEYCAVEYEEEVYYSEDEDDEVEDEVNDEYEEEYEDSEYEDDEYEETPPELEAEFRDMSLMDETNYEEEFD